MAEGFNGKHPKRTDTDEDGKGIERNGEVIRSGNEEK
jgi:hypothetical protein